MRRFQMSEVDQMHRTGRRSGPSPQADCAAERPQMAHCGDSDLFDFLVFCFLLFRNTLIILDSSSSRRFLNTKMNKSVFQQKCLTQVFCFKVLQRISGGHLSFQFLAVDVLLNFQVQKHICILLISVDSTATGLISLYICIRFV